MPPRRYVPRPRMRDARHERILSLLYALAFAIFRRLVLALCWCLRRRSLPALVKLCHKRLLPKLPPFTTDVRLRLAPSVTLRCFQLGGEHHADILSEWLLLSGTWQPNLSAWLRRTLHRGDTFVDVGANTGYFSLLAAALVHGEGGGVVAIEACPRTFRRLQTNLMRNAGLASCIRSLQLAAAEAEGSTTLFQHRREPLYSTTVAGAGAGGVAASADVWSIVQASGATRRDQTASASVAQLAQDSACWHQVTVRKAPLDELLSADECARARVVKVDVEGGEWTVLRGMARVLESASPELEIVVEVTPKWLALQQVTPAQVLAFMAARGFHAYVLHEEYQVDHASSTIKPEFEPDPPRRLGEGELETLEQADIIFSRRDVAYL